MKKFSTLLIVSVLLALLALPIWAQDDPELEPWTCPEGFTGQTLNIYNWSTYIGENTVRDFEEACGVTVVYSVYASNEELLSRLRAGNPGFDIAIPSEYMVATLISEGLIEPINLDNIPNFENINPKWRDTPYDPGNQYSITYMWSTVGIGYNIEATGGEITSWDQVMNYDGPVAWLDDVRTMLMVGLLMTGSDPNSTDPDEIAAARDYLIEHGDNVIIIAEDDGQEWLVRGEVDIAVEYSGDIFQVIDECECDTYVYAIPSEGSNVSFDGVVIPTDAQNHALAEVFMDYILDPQAGADIANFIAYSTTNQAAIDAGLIDPEQLENPGIYPSDEMLENLYFFEDNPDAEELYNEAWEEIKIALSQ